MRRCDNLKFTQSEDVDYFFDTIEYRIEEVGYPNFSHDIFEICSSLKKNGRKLDGEYINSQIKNRKKRLPKLLSFLKKDSPKIDNKYIKS